MKKLIYLVLAAGAIIGLLSLKPLGIIAQSESYFELKETTDIEEFEAADFYVELVDGYRINVDFIGAEGKYTGTVYLPGNVDALDCKLSWDSEEETYISKRLKHYDSGEFPLAGDGYKAIFMLNCGDKKYDLMLKTAVCSANIEPLLITIDESLGTIADMNADWYHETSCYGELALNDNNYYMSIKGRGNATWHYCPKKPYNISFLKEAYEGKANVSMLEGTETRKWSLLANYGDPSLLRNRIGYLLADKMGVGLPSKYFDVWMNGDYLGNYLATPKNDYQASDNGFILELDNQIDEEDPQFYLSNEHGIIESMRFTIKDNSSDWSSEDISNWIDLVFRAIEDYESDEYLNYIDLDSWAKVYLLHELFKNYDVVNGSILMHRDGISADDKLFAGPIWDLDNALGTTNWNIENGMDFETALSADKSYIEAINLSDNNYCWLQELGKHQSFINRVKELYQEYKYLFDDLNNVVDEQCALLGTSALINSERWGLTDLEYNNFQLSEELEFYNCDYPFKYVKPVDYYDYVLNLNTYIAARTQFLADYYLQ